MSNYTKGSCKIVSWICKQNTHHKWSGKVYYRTSKRKSKCPICTNKLICPADQCNSLYYKCSGQLKKEWDKAKNGSMKKYTPNSNKKVQWKCCNVKHHEWSSPIDRRMKWANCPICCNQIICPVDQCNSLYYNCNKIIKKEWDEKKNGSMKKYTPCTAKKVWWICSKNNHHMWEALICSRTSKRLCGCPICSHHLICPIDQCNSLYYNCSDKIKKEWNKKKNDSMKNYTPYSGKKVAWLCSKINHHEWDATIYNRTKCNRGCPMCSGNMICPVDQCNSFYHNCLDQLKKEWCEEKNDSMKKYTPHSNKVVWWKCNVVLHHIWKAQINTRSKGHGCPICSHHLLCPIDQCNSLYYNCTDLIKKEWHEEKNGSHQ